MRERDEALRQTTELVKLLTTQQLSEVTGKSPRSHEKERVEGRGIPFIKMGRSVRYDPQDVQEYLRQRRRTSTSDPGPGSQP